MPEIKNTFLEGKMNKDLDARLLKNGEYFDAQNIHITKSEGSDVGTVQNILGNKLNYTTGAFKPGVRTTDDLGIITTNTSDGTNAAGAGYSGVPNVTSGFTTNGNGVGGSVNIIIDGGTVTKVTFSGTSSGYKVGDTITISKDTGTPAIGGSTSVVLTLREEDLLITEDIGTVIGHYADNELKNGKNSIYYFVKGNSSHKDNVYYYQEGAVAPIPLINNTTDFLKFDTDFLITGVNVIDELLFWTDNKNQPRKINTVTAVNNPSHYSNEDKISVAKYYPYTAPKVLRQVGGNDHCGMQVLQTKGTLNGAVNGKVLTILESSDTNHEIHEGMEVYDGTTTLNAVVESVTNNGLTVNVDANISKGNGTVLTFINQNDRLEEKFVRFAYRFQFKDNEYSLIAPFTQHCFIPQTYNDAYANHSANGLTAAQELKAAESTILESMVNDASHINLQIEFPSATPTTDFEIEKIEILIKESDRPDIKSIAQFDITDASVGSDKIYNYTYKGSLPYKTLTEQQLTRVYDNVPAKAKAQEIVSNRVVYGNYQEGAQNKPYDIDTNYSFDYNINISDKNDTQKFVTQYPKHTIKTRRQYQVGVVLADKYGRQSPVFLSDDTGNSILSVTAQSSTETPTTWNGQALEITFNKKIPATDASGRSILHSATNPTGWYTYKIVVKQNEYEYYNIYAPEGKDELPNAQTQLAHSGLFFSDEDKRTWLVLHGDNINKVPRDTTESSEDDNSIFPTDVDLYPKINSHISEIMCADPLVNIIGVGKAMDHGLEFFLIGASTPGVLEETGHTYRRFYNYRSNPLLAELPNGYGRDITVTANSQAELGFRGTTGFSVWETKGFESALDIYYETVTCGLISELNDEILQGPGASGVPTSIKFSDGTTQTNLPENQTSGNVVGSTHFQTFNQGPGGTTPAQIANSGITYSVINVKKNGTEIDTTGNLFFDIQDAGNNQQQLKTTSNFGYFGTSSDTYTVTIKAIDSSNNSAIQDFSVFITNSTPIITVPNTATHQHFNSSATIFSPTTGQNGSADSTQNTSNITYSITSVIFDPSGTPDSSNTQLNKFSINATTGAVSPNNHVFPASEVGKVYRVTVQINDNSGQSNNVATDSCDVTIGLWQYGTFRFSTGFSGGTALCNAWCGNGSTQTFYIKRPSSNTSSSLTPQLNDLVYTDAAGTTSFSHGFIIRQLIGATDGTGYSVYVNGGSINDVDHENQCSGYSC